MGVLTLSGTAASGAFSLVGFTDWRVWGYSGNGVVSKNIVSHLITDSIPYGTIDTSNTALIQFTWNDGDLVPSATNAKAGQYKTALNSTLSFSATASTTVARILNIYVGLFNVTCQLDLSLSDSSASPISDSSFGSVGSVLTDIHYTVTFQSNAAATLNVTCKLKTINGANPKLYLRGAALSGDPHFMGFDKIMFDYQGRGDAFYSLLNDYNINVNAHFKRFDSKTTVVTDLGVQTLGPSGLSKINFSANGSLVTTRGDLYNPVFIYREVSDILKLDILPDVLRDGAPTIIDAAEVVIDPYRLIVSRMELNGVRYLNINTKMNNDYHGFPSGIIGQTALPPRSRIHNDNFEVCSLFDTKWKHNHFMKTKVV